jgi:hypothetical protein
MNYQNNNTAIGVAPMEEASYNNKGRKYVDYGPCGLGAKACRAFGTIGIVACDDCSYNTPVMPNGGTTELKYKEVMVGRSETLPVGEFHTVKLYHQITVDVTENGDVDAVIYKLHKDCTRMLETLKKEQGLPTNASCVETRTEINESAENEPVKPEDTNQRVPKKSEPKSQSVKPHESIKIGDNEFVTALELLQKQQRADEKKKNNINIDPSQKTTKPDQQLQNTTEQLGPISRSETKQVQSQKPQKPKTNRRRRDNRNRPIGELIKQYNIKSSRYAGLLRWQKQISYREWKRLHEYLNNQGIKNYIR